MFQLLNNWNGSTRTFALQMTTMRKTCAYIHSSRAGLYTICIDWWRYIHIRLIPSHGGQFIYRPTSALYFTRPKMIMILAHHFPWLTIESDTTGLLGPIRSIYHVIYNMLRREQLLQINHPTTTGFNSHNIWVAPFSPRIIGLFPLSKSPHNNT